MAILLGAWGPLVPAYASPALSAPQFGEWDFALQEPLPMNDWNLSLPSSERFWGMRLTIGDVDGDGVGDLVYTNQSAFLRVYFMETAVGTATYPNPSGTGTVTVTTDILQEKLRPSAPHHVDGPGFNWNVPCTGMTNSYSQRSLCTETQAAPLIYDIDMDGVNEIIYLKAVEGPGVSDQDRLQVAVYDYDPVNHQLVEKIMNGTPSVNDLNKSGPGYFATDCMSIDSQRRGELTVGVGNFRGRAFPQDIYVFGTGDGTRDVYVFAYDNDTGQGPTITEMAALPGLFPNPINDSETGHNWGAFDVDYDGRDELVGNAVYFYSDATGSFHVLSPDHAPVPSTVATVFKLDGALPADNDVHPDKVIAADFWTTYKDPAGNIIPCPGSELLVAPQLHVGSSFQNSPGLSGPWVYRAVAGHQLMKDSSFGRRWPRKLLNFDDTLASDGYWFTTTAVSSMVQPSGLSGWDVLANWFGGGAIPDLNSQSVMVANLVPGSDGKELLVVSKSTPAGVSAGTGCYAGQTYFMFGSDDDSTVLDFGESLTGSNGPTIAGLRLADVRGTREVKEVLTMTSNGCRDSSNLPMQNIREFHWDSSGSTVTIGSDWTSGGYPALGNHVYPYQAFGVADLVADSREEILYTHQRNWSTPKVTTVKMARELAAVTRNEVTPQAYRAYNQRDQRGDDSLDLDELDGLILTKRLPVGVAGQPYGVAQDVVIAGGTSQFGIALMAEGGVAPYTITIEPGSENLPKDSLGAPLATTAITGAFGGLLISGTPAEHGVRKLKIKVVDSSPTPIVKDFVRYLTISEGPASIDSKPKIVAGGFGWNQYLEAGVGGVLSVHARVEDADADTTTVYVLLAGSPILQLTQLYPGYWEGNLPIPGLPALETTLTMLAVDSANNVSLPWPYMVVDGGEGDFNPSLETGVPAGQTAATTPVIFEVGFTPDSMTPAERLEQEETVVVDVTIGQLPKGYVLDHIESRVSHPLTAGAHFDPINFTPLSPLFHRGKFNAPSGQFGFGYYGVSVRVVAAPSGGGALVYSDWWPNLVVH